MNDLNPHEAIKMMSPEEARQRVTWINCQVNNIRAALLDFYERDGWKALGYENWRECVTAEFGQSQRHLYRQLEAAQIEVRILQADENTNENGFCPIGQKPEIPESHLRPLAAVPPEDQSTAWQLAKETVPGGKLTARHVESVVREISGEKPRKTYTVKSYPPGSLLKEEKADAITLARLAISTLEKIKEDDPKRKEAIALVARYCWEQRQAMP